MESVDENGAGVGSGAGAKAKAAGKVSHVARKRLAKNWRAAFCERIEAGRSARSVCSDPDIPGKTLLFKTLADEPEFAEQYARACEWRADTHVDEILEIADDASNDWMERNDPENPGFDFNGEHIQRSRLRVDSRKWLVGKLAPKKYGDRLNIDAVVTVDDVPEADKVAKFIAQIPVMNEVLAGYGWRVVRVE